MSSDLCGILHLRGVHRYTHRHIHTHTHMLTHKNKEANDYLKIKELTGTSEMAQQAKVLAESVLTPVLSS